VTSREPSDLEGKLMRWNLGSTLVLRLAQAKKRGCLVKLARRRPRRRPRLTQSSFAHMSLLPTSMSDCDASSRYLAFRRWTSEPKGLHLTRSAMRVTGVSAEPRLGMGFGDRYGDFRGASGSFKGGVQPADKPCDMRGKRASAPFSHHIAAGRILHVRRGSAVRVRQRLR
jgi:hypothetical protein